MTGRPMATPGVSAGDVLGLIRGHAVVTRADIRRLTGLSRTAVTLRVEQLLDRGLVAERADGGSTGGRPPTRLVFNPESGVVLAASIGASRAQVAVCDLAGRVLAESEFVVPPGGVTQAVLIQAAEQMDRLLAGEVDETHPSGVRASNDAVVRHGGSRGDGDDGPMTDVRRTPGRVVHGIGICVPSAVDVATGHSMGAGPGLGDVSVAEYFSERFGVPVRVDSDVNALALAEHARHPQVGDLLLLKASTGIGAGIVAGGRLLRGAWGGAGEIGHIKVADAPDRPCRCGDMHCLETVAGGWALLEQLAAQGKSISGLPELVDLARAGEPEATRVIREAGRRIGEVVAGAVNLLNPALIIVRGDLSHAFEPLAAGMREVIYQRSSALATRSLRVEPGAADAPSGVAACAAMILDQVLAPAAVNALLDA
ncbi:putative NBD/HSP70 family sugar kinase [Nocardia sp. GAS34]|uniref:ROK family transcriptional regulator n=1 Tax=unclassified Nocardia TaxID=2637762 RepID=UPI003D1BD69B